MTSVLAAAKSSKATDVFTLVTGLGHICKSRRPNHDGIVWFSQSNEIPAIEARV